MIKERPILFNSDMVRAILDDRKTQTRRVIRPQPIWEEEQGLTAAGWKWKTKKVGLSAWPDIDDFLCELGRYCPYGKVGDLLWCKETFNDCDGTYYYNPKYKATSDDGSIKWKSSRFMPKKYARIWLEITGIRVEKIQNTTTKDILAEGIVDQRCGADGLMCDFATLWNSINAKRGFGWDTNSYVWCISFKKINSNQT